MASFLVPLLHKKSLGDFDVSVKLHPEITAAIKVTVVQEAIEVAKITESVKEETSS